MDYIQNHLPGKLKRPLMCYRKPPNLKDKLIQAKFSDGTQGKRTCNHYKMVPLQNRPLATYSKTPLTANTKFITLRCSMDHRIITDEYINLLEATKIITRDRHLFITQHQTCGKIHIIPIHAYANITTKCTECDFIYTN